MSIEFPTLNIAIDAIPKLEMEGIPENVNYLFSYSITIQNNESFSIRLLRRKWDILDGLFVREVEGAGVVGQQPILNPGESFEYKSFCPLMEDIGGMKGYFTFEKLPDRKRFKVEVPSMNLMPIYRLN